jgi:hypothetical protein
MDGEGDAGGILGDEPEVKGLMKRGKVAIDLVAAG